MLINISPNFLYWQGNIQRIEEVHAPYFLALPPSAMDCEKARENIVKKFENDSRVKKIGEIETYCSFWNPSVKRKVFKIYTARSYMVPEVSDEVFCMGLYTGEHDIPYTERALTDLAAQGTWICDTQGKERKMSVMVYDIEMTKYGEVEKVPIDIIGYYQFQFSFASEQNLDNEDFSFQFVDFPKSIEGEIPQMMAHNEEEEIKNLLALSNIIKNCDIVAGHNIIGFDNLQVYQRVQHLLSAPTLSDAEKKELRSFLENYSRRDQSFHFGSPSEVAIFYPSSFDTYQAARKFYALDDFSLGGVARFLNVHIEDRLHLSPEHMALDDKTLRYNRQDIEEEVAITLYLLQQALPLAFTTGMPFELLLPSGTTKMWDYMAMTRASKYKKIMPPTCRALSIAAQLEKFGKTKEEIADGVRKGGGKDITRVAKYGEEMPDWVEYPYLIYDARSRDIAYHFPGGMTIKPDRDANSHFVPWYHVIVADVGAMYPTILRAVNAGADTVRLAKEEEADEWVWLKKLPEEFLDTKVQKRETREEFVDKGVMIGVKIAKEAGVINRAMVGIMKLIDKIKKEMKEKEGEEKKRLAMIYQSLKGARNAGTHGILSAPKVSCRQFNLWGASLITTKGQQILNDTLAILKKKGIRVVYGDTDGIYVACSRSASSKLASALNVQSEKKWITSPGEVLNAIEFCNEKWRNELHYEQFELEAEEHEVMVFVKHKNYLIFDVMNGNVMMMTTKGNNFKGSDKPDIARMVLKDIMLDVLRENVWWENEEEAREGVKKSIKNVTTAKVSSLDIEKFDMDAFTLVQSVQPPRSYKPNMDGTPSVYGERAKALEKLMGRIRARRKFKFVITRKPLPGIKNPTKSGVKPIHYMYPLEFLKGRDELDMEWYREMIKNFIQGAFGLSDLRMGEQYGLEKWM